MPGEPVLETKPSAPASGPILDTRPVYRALPDAGAGPRFAVGRLVSRTMSTWWRHVFAFSLLSLVTNAPWVLWMWEFSGAIEPPGARDPEELRRLVVYWPVVMLGAVVLHVVQLGAVTYGTVRHLKGERASLGEMLGVAVRRGLPVVGTGFLLWLALLAGAIALVIPAFIIAVGACVAIPAAVIERPGIAGAISRSFALTRGNRWRLFGAFLALICVVWGLAMAVQVPLTIAAVLATGGKGASMVLPISQLGNALFSVIPSVGMAVAYHDLRLEKEGVDASALAKVFE